MFEEENYRFCTRLSLQIMREQRECLCHDSTQHGVALYTALHETNPQVRHLRFQYYLVDWFDNHWNNLRSLLDRHPEYTVDQKKQITLFFAERFVGLLDMMSESVSMADLCIPDLLSIRKTILKKMIETSEKWEKKSDEFCLQNKKCEEQFKALIMQYDKQ